MVDSSLVVNFLDGKSVVVVEESARDNDTSDEDEVDDDEEIEDATEMLELERVDKLSGMTVDDDSSVAADDNKGVAGGGVGLEVGVEAAADE